MQQQIKYKRIIFLFALLASTTLFCLSTPAETTDSPNDLTITLGEIAGTVQMLKPAVGLFEDVNAAQLVSEGEQVLTHADGFASLAYSTGAVIRMGPLSLLTVNTAINGDTGLLTSLNLETGEIWAVAEHGTVEVTTANGVISATRAFLNIWVVQETKAVIVTCLAGICQVANQSGAVQLTSGQSAAIADAVSPPTTGKMSAQDISRWLQFNPEATQQIPILTMTVSVPQSSPTPAATNTSTPCPYPGGWTVIVVLPGETIASLAEKYGVSASQMARGNCLDIFSTPQAGISFYIPPPLVEPTATAENCGPPQDWIIHTVKSGETLETLSVAYRVKIADLQYANCMGESTVLVSGQAIYLPAVVSPVPTPSGTPQT